MPFPHELRTARLLLRPWRAEDAAELLPILEANHAHLAPWIPARVADPAPLPVLAERLAGFAEEFSADRAWRFALFARDGGQLLGEVDLFPRNGDGRVALPDADRAELGYWLRAGVTGRGIVTEAARAVLDVVATMPQFTQVEIRCDARNAPSVTVATRLGFSFVKALAEASTAGGELQLWVLAIPSLR